MGWWSLANGDEIGDQPANLVEIALGTRDASDRPTPDAFMQALADALAERAGVTNPSIEGLRVTHAGGGEQRYVSQSNAAPDGIGGPTRALIDSLMACYQRYLSRPALVSELCSVFAFVLRPDPSRFLSVAESWRLRTIEPILRSSPSQPRA